MRNRNRAFQPDPLLFPSTWKPLKLFAAAALLQVLATCRTESNYGRLIMRQYLLERVAYDEWHRILMKEKRVALAAFLHSASFLACFGQLSTAAFSHSRLSVTLLAPVLLASLFSWWMNIVSLLLYSIRCNRAHHTDTLLTNPYQFCALHTRSFTGSEWLQSSAAGNKQVRRQMKNP
jgi:tryptophan-rich sensory protein